jgi:syntaxin-binding protein 1
MFPYVRDAPTATASAASLRTTAAPTPAGSLRSAKPNWHRAPQRGAVNEVRQRLIVFVAGGMTYSEMRAAYQLSASLGKDIFIGAWIMVLIEEGI